MLKKTTELEPGVAPHARIGSATTAVLACKIIDDLLEVAREIERIERDAQAVGHATGIEGVGGTAATLVTRSSFHHRELPRR
jgi:hypothetical protein